MHNDYNDYSNNIKFCHIRTFIMQYTIVKIKKQNTYQYANIAKAKI